MRTRSTLFLASLLAGITACSDVPTATPPASTQVEARLGGAERVTSVASSVRWTRKAVSLFRARGGIVSRINAYVALAQYRGVLAALREHGRRFERATLAGAVAGGSDVVLKNFYPLDSASIDAMMAQQRTEQPDADALDDFDAGVVIGRGAGVRVLAQAATDNYNLTDPGPPPVGPGYWVSSGAPTVRGGFGARPFFMHSGSELRLGPPPTFGSSRFLAQLAEVRAISDTRTPDQVALVRRWAPFSDVVFDSIATGLIESRHRGELESVAILAYGNAASYDAIVACFDTKFTYWHIRPTQADPHITTAVPLPNHPSWPSGHSCASGAWSTILRVAFPADRRMIDSLASDASLSRLVGGLHYRSDTDAGTLLGQRAATLALRRGGLE